MTIKWFMLGFQKLSKDVAAVISVGIVMAIEYQKFHLDIWHEYYDHLKWELNAYTLRRCQYFYPTTL